MKRGGFSEVVEATTAGSPNAGAEHADSERLKRPKETVRGEMVYRQSAWARGRRPRVAAGRPFVRPLCGQVG
jgi:hypothetical protein